MKKLSLEDFAVEYAIRFERFMRTCTTAEAMRNADSLVNLTEAHPAYYEAACEGAMGTLLSPDSSIANLKLRELIDDPHGSGYIQQVMGEAYAIAADGAAEE